MGRVQSKTDTRVKKTIMMTGGGTAGHVTPNIALMPRLRELGYNICYVGSVRGIERELVQREKIPYYGISSGKLRRYLDLKNISDPFRVLKGYAQARWLIRKVKPDVVFSKGGFVTVPVVLAAKHKKVHTIIHESDMSPGLANRIAIPAADMVCCSFPETVEMIPGGKGVLTGLPIREQLLRGERERAYTFTGLCTQTPTILVMGGSLGAKAINEALRAALPDLLPDFQVVHLCGRGNLDPAQDKRRGYVQYEYINAELADLFDMADLVISRAGANAVFELLALRKPNILIPLSQNVSRGDQIQNADSFKKHGFSFVLKEEEANAETLLKAVRSVWARREEYAAAMRENRRQDSISAIIDLIETAAGRK